MQTEKLPYRRPAVLAWFPEGEKPKAGDFNVEHVKPDDPPYPNPEAWNTLAEAVIYARHNDRRNHRKFPWMQFEGRILKPDEILDAYQHLKDTGGVK